MGVQQILHQMTVATPGRGFTRLDGRLNTWIRSTGLDQGVLHLTCLHTSASLTINENADPRVLQDLDAWMADAVPEHRRYLHDDEGADDMPAHIRTALTSQTLNLSVSRGNCCWAPGKPFTSGSTAALLTPERSPATCSVNPPAAPPLKAPRRTLQPRRKPC